MFHVRAKRNFQLSSNLLFGDFSMMQQFARFFCGQLSVGPAHGGARCAVYCQGKLTRENYGRDHHLKCFTIWMAGGGIKPGIVYGETDDFSYNIVENPVHIHDLNATILKCLGIDHKRLSYKFQGLDMRLTGVEEQHPVEGLLV